MSQPNKTLYIKNLNDQVKKEELKLQLYALFTPYGRIVDVVAMKSQRMRGQAFVVFQDLAGATAAMRAWDGEVFYDKEMKIEYAKTRSYATRKIEEPGWDPLTEAKAKALGLGSRLKRDPGRQDEGEAMDMDDDQGAPSAPAQPNGPPRPHVCICVNRDVAPRATRMNTLGYISRQYDALASTPTTPTCETAPLSSPFGRAQADMDTRVGRHSPKLRSKSLSRTRQPESEPTSDEPARSRRRRFVLVRFFIGLWHGVCALWWLLPAWKRVRHNFGLITLQADDTSDEKDDDEDEYDPLVARAPPPEKHKVSFESGVLNRRTSRSRYKPPTPAVSPVDIDKQEPDAPTRPRAPSVLLPNPLSTSLLTPSASALPSRASTPPIRRPTALHKPKMLVLDLDETLIHSTSRPMHAHGSMGGGGLLGLSGLFGGKRQGAGHMVEVVLHGRSTLYHVYKRPFVDFFLRKVSAWYTLVIFTASMPEYADPVIDWLDAGRGMFARRLFRESCTQLPNGGYTKDLSIIDQDLSRICLIDNSPSSYSINNANGIPIEGWISDPGDEALLDLLPILDSLRFTSDVRHVLGLRGF